MGAIPPRPCRRIQHMQDWLVYHAPGHHATAVINATAATAVPAVPAVPATAAAITSAHQLEVDVPAVAMDGLEQNRAGVESDEAGTLEGVSPIYPLICRTTHGEAAVPVRNILRRRGMSDRGCKSKLIVKAVQCEGCRSLPFTPLPQPSP